MAIRADRVVAIGKLAGAHARRVIDATGLVVAPGFIDMLGQSEMSLLIDNRALSKLSQGITSEITGEGGSIAPQPARWEPIDDFRRTPSCTLRPSGCRPIDPHVGADAVMR